MRVELRLERDEHEYAITIECDQSVPVGLAIRTATDALDRIADPYQSAGIPLMPFNQT